MPLKLVASADQHIVASPGSDHEIVGDETVPALYQIKNAFGFSNSAAPREEETDAEYIRKGSVKRSRRRKLTFEHGFYTPIELGGLEAGSEECDARLRRCACQTIGEILALCHDHRGQREGKVCGKDFIPVRRFERSEIGNLRLTEHLETLGNEPLDIAGKSEPRTGEIGSWNVTVESPPVPEVFELQRFSAALEKLTNRK
jgi:hypothetical protein